MSESFHWIAIAVITVMSSARLTRLITWDKFPPVAWAREQYFTVLDGGPRRRQWQILAYCPWCASFWITLGVVLWGWLTCWQTAWWVANGVLGASYLAAIVMVHDGDDSDEESD